MDLVGKAGSRILSATSNDSGWFSLTTVRKGSCETGRLGGARVGRLATGLLKIGGGGRLGSGHEGNGCSGCG